jgi:alpha-galactosidase
MPPDRLKIAVLGAGSFDVGPSLLSDALLVHKLDGVELALVDSDEEMIFAMADLGRRMVVRSQLDTQITAHTNREAALQAATYVICCGAGVPPASDPSHTGAIPHGLSGVEGLALSLRQIAFIQQVCEEMKRLARPDAMLLNLADPLPRVCQAAHEAGVPTIGFCGHSLAAYKIIWEILHEEKIDYPFEEAREHIDLAMAGLNHLTFALDLWDHDTGDDLYRSLKEMAADGLNADQPLTASLLLDLGYLPTAGDHRVRDFVEPPDSPLLDDEDDADPPSPKAIQRRMDLLRAAAAGKKSWDPLLEKPVWARPFDLVAAVSFKRPAAFAGLNLVNQHQLTQLPRGIFVETPAMADPKGLRTPKLDLPEPLVPLLTRAAQLTDTILRAARRKSRDLLHEAIDLDPTIPDKAQGREALDHCLTNHADLLAGYK